MMQPSFNFQNDIRLDYFTPEFKCLVPAVYQQIPAPYPIIVSAIMTTLATSMQDLIMVKMPNGVVNPVSLSIGVIAESGDRKTSVLKLLMKPILELDGKIKEKFKREEEIHTEKMSVHKIQVQFAEQELRKAMKKKNDINIKSEALLDIKLNKPVAPSLNIRCRNNTTIPALMRNMQNCTVGQLFITTEAAGTINNMSMGDIGNLISLVDGEPINVDRVSSTSYEIQNRCLSLSFSLQPQLYSDILTKKNSTLVESGFFPRMLLSYPLSIQGMRPQSNHGHHSNIASFHERIEDLLQSQYQQKGDHEKKMMVFDCRATEMWRAYAADLESSIAINGCNRDVSKWVNRILDNVSRMAALIEYYHQDTYEMQSDSIGVSSLSMAIELGRFWLMEAKKLFGDASGVQKQRELAMNLCQYFLRKYNPNSIEFTLRDIYTNGPRELRSAHTSREIIDFLNAQGLVAPSLSQTGKSPIYILTPKFAQTFGLPYPAPIYGSFNL